MAERFSEIEKASSPKPNLEERLREYPELKGKIESLLGIIENAGGDIEKAAEAERRIIEELRQMGNEVLHGWARRQQRKKEEEYNAKPGINRKEKKTSTGTHDWEKSK
jgi:hypothetical protein